jgi:hypothetical protein
MTGDWVGAGPGTETKQPGTTVAVEKNDGHAYASRFFSFLVFLFHDHDPIE